jgi:hypothetical protein
VYFGQVFGNYFDLGGREPERDVLLEIEDGRVIHGEVAEPS